MRVLVTRPKDDADEIAARLRARGHDVLIAPLLDIRFRDGANIPLADIQAVLATSANGVRALARRTPHRTIPIYAVGPQTAAEAARLGFANIRDAQGDARALAEAVQHWADPAQGALLHAAGADTKGDLVARLRAAGFTARTETLYDALAVAALPAPVRQALEQDRLDAVLLFSPRSARILAEGIEAAGLSAACARLIAAAISPAAAAPLAGLPFTDIRAAGAPNQESLLSLLD